MDEAIKARVVKRMTAIDALPPKTRELVHEFGWSVVKEFLDAGVTKPERIMHIIKTVLQGSSEGRTRPLIFLDDAPAALAGTGLAVIPERPTDEMIAASMAEVSNFNMVVSKEEKHRLRLMAAIRAGRVKYRP